MNKLGHNSFVGTINGILCDYVERIERLELEKQTVAEDMKEVFGEAKSNGFDVKIMKKIITLRKMEAAEREEQETLIELYKQALGMTPLEKAIIEQTEAAYKAKNK